MSLLHRTSSTESFHRRGSRSSPPRSPYTNAQHGGPIREATTLYYDTVESQDGRARKLSYNPVGHWVPPKAHEPPIGAYEVPTAKRIGMLPPHTEKAPT